MTYEDVTPKLIRKQLGPHIHFWPFDGWDLPAGRSVIAEVYPSLWRHSFEREVARIEGWILGVK